ncbi:copper amine oxidase N-terminal domain-containing protein [Anaerobacillus alkaliphilus]|uniref:Copper amine oxidase N-terminal domain-containing protein n=2 Tax=Anaerobacillus alkaliphilus TaxID=1548597 RepID=A0A4Q0VYK7_9BACI|nr:copper amine oxidase N-terminal domain-containing protein [Anaerobacillus alkaliphilus]
MANPVAANERVSVFIDRQQLYFDQDPIIENGRTLVPMRHVFEKLGATIHWNASTNTITAKKHRITVVLKVNSNQAIINGEAVRLDVPAKIVNGRTLVPLRFVTQALGGKVEWDGNAQNVYITTVKSDIDVILNTIFQIEMSTLRILHKEMESELFHGAKKPFSSIEPKLTNYYTDSYIQEYWKPFYESSHFSEWYTHTGYLFNFLINEPFLSETLNFEYRKDQSEIMFRFRDDPRVNEGPMGVTIKNHEYILLNIENGWRVDRIY